MKMTKKRKLNEISVNNSHEIENMNQEKVSNSKRPKINYTDYFLYTTNQEGESIGRCKECSQNGLNKEYRRKKSSTNGMKNHLEKDHKKIYDLYFDPNKSRNQPTLPKNQTTLDDFTNVSTRALLISV